MKKKKSNILAFLSTYPPRECGIATYTSDLVNALKSVYTYPFTPKVIALNPNEITRYRYSTDVIAQVSQSNKADLIECARMINAHPDILAVHIQHEFGLFAGTYGSYLLHFLHELRKPYCVTFHTVLPQPSDEMRSVVGKIAQTADRVIVMTGLSKDILVADYSIPESLITVIAHGIHDLPFDVPLTAKKRLGIQADIMLSTFGLLNRGKGIEYVIDALPALIRMFPDTHYYIIGATHPRILEKEGESYRNSLLKKIRAAGITHHVHFINQYLSLPELMHYLSATDIYVAPSLDANQAVSGTLSYALGAGRPVVATAFSHARSLAQSGALRVVPMRDSAQMQAVLYDLISHAPVRQEMSRRAYHITRPFVWANAALNHGSVYQSLMSCDSFPFRIPPLKLRHMEKLTDTYGIIQFADLTIPELTSGYTADDNARALISMIEYYKLSTSDKARRLMIRYFSFLRDATREDGLFCNYRTGMRQPDEEKNRSENLAEAQARTIYAFAYAATSSIVPISLLGLANKLCAAHLERMTHTDSPRAHAFLLKAFTLLAASRQSEQWRGRYRQTVDFLLRIYRDTATSDWRWYEQSLTYGNAIIPDALLCASHISGGDDSIRTTALESLDFLIEQTFHDGIYEPIGQRGWYSRGKDRSYFDQQPEDAATMVSALTSAYAVSGTERYRALAKTAFEWFLGNNQSRQTCVVRSTGGCYDGITPEGVNVNQGAESTISYLLARIAIEKMDL
ncbi:glycosyltransferase [Candidatus Uhrbacteria bacterium]|nr:glycosyltransferase [Candidatus Uhrbacteria bacterium]